MRRLLTHCFFLLFPSLLFCFSNDSTTFLIHSNLSSKSQSFFQFDLSEELEINCSLKTISPIDQKPETILITFKNIKASCQWDDQSYTLNTQDTENTKPEFQALLRILNRPIEIHLNRDLTLQAIPEDFKKILEDSALKNRFLSPFLLEQILEAILSPLKATAQEPFSLSIPYPLKSRLQVDLLPNGKSKKNQLLFEQDLHLTGAALETSPDVTTSFIGDLSGQLSWGDGPFVEQFSFKETLEEKGDILFEQPLQFVYHFQLKRQS